jgi:hypothetical protein
MKMLCPFRTLGGHTPNSKASHLSRRKLSAKLLKKPALSHKYCISRPIRRTFFPRKSELNSNCVLYAEGKYLFPNLSISDTSSKNNCEDDFSGSDDDFLDFYDE